jgi:HK97 gp10 family phage protein
MADVQGVAEFNADIQRRNAELEASLPDIVMHAAKIVEQEIRSRAPVATGGLVRSLDAKSERRKGNASAIVEIERSGPDGVEHYAYFQEYGTSKMPANPFFRPGVEAAKDKVPDAMTHDISQVIDR